MNSNEIPEASYGILRRDSFESILDETAEQIRRLGYAIVDSGYTRRQKADIAEQFNQTRASYVRTFGEQRLRQLNEYHTIRALLTHGGKAFINMATNPGLLGVMARLMVGQFILNQQNGIINPPGESYNQQAWHRDLPYQHFTSSSPLAVNALYCVDDFTEDNGATLILPASHKNINFPSDHYLKSHATRVEARAGQFILLDCMLFHCGGINTSPTERRAINQVYTIPYLKQQISLPENLKVEELTQQERQLFGFPYTIPATVAEYLESRNNS